MTELQIAPGFALPANAVTETFGILGQRGSGKSTAAVVMAEEMWDAGLPWVAVDPKGDWWGVRSSADGKSPGLALPVFGGLHGDVPLEATAGNVIADLIVEQNLTCVLDVSDFSKADRARFLLAFFDRLYRNHRADPQPRHVFLEEAHEYIPQMVGREEGRLKEAAARLVLQGRTFGLGVSVCSQRSARLHKDVLTQVGTLIAMRTPGALDRKAIEGWVTEHDVAKELLASLPGLEPGEAWIWSPSFLRVAERIRFRRRRTFDSGSTPTVGKSARPPATLADVDLGAIKDAMAETIERAKADDPKALRKQITQLGNELHTLRAHLSAATPEPTVEIREVPVETIVTVTETLLSVQLVERFEEALQPFVALAGEMQMKLARDAEPRPWPAVDMMSDKSVDRKPSTIVRQPARPAASPGAIWDTTGTATIGKTERNVLTVLVLHGALTHAQIALLSGYSVKASTIGVALGKLRKAGLVDTNGQPVRATQAGVDYLGSDVEPLPTGKELLDYWRNRFGLTERRVLDVLVTAWPHESSLAEVAEVTGYSASASTIGVAMGKLRKVGVVDRWRLSVDFGEAIS